MIEAVGLSKHANDCLDHYRTRFEALFGDKCAKISDFDLEKALSMLKGLISYYGPLKTKAYIDLYLTLDDDWLQERGYPLEFLPKRINGLIVKQSSMVGGGGDIETRYVVALSESGRPVIDKNPHVMRDYKPVSYKAVPVSQWQELPYEERLQGIDYAAKGYDVGLWFAFWNVVETMEREPWVKGVVKKNGEEQ